MPLLSRFLPFLSMQISVSQQTYDLGRHTDDLQIERFQAILNESLFSGGKKLLSQRELGKILDVTIGIPYVHSLFITYVVDKHKSPLNSL